MQAIYSNWLINLFAITLNFSTGEIGWSSSTTASDISGGLDNLLLADGTSNLTLQSDTVNDVLLLA